MPAKVYARVAPVIALEKFNFFLVDVPYPNPVYSVQAIASLVGERVTIAQGSGEWIYRPISPFSLGNRDQYQPSSQALGGLSVQSGFQLADALVVVGDATPLAGASDMPPSYSPRSY